MELRLSKNDNCVQQYINSIAVEFPFGNSNQFAKLVPNLKSCGFSRNEIIAKPITNNTNENR